MFEQFTPPEQPLVSRIAQRFQISSIFLLLLSNRFLFGELVPDRIAGLLLGVALGLMSAALTLHTVGKREERRSRVREAAANH